MSAFSWNIAQLTDILISLNILKQIHSAIETKSLEKSIQVRKP